MKIAADVPPRTSATETAADKKGSQRCQPARPADPQNRNPTGSRGVGPPFARPRCILVVPASKAWRNRHVAHGTNPRSRWCSVEQRSLHPPGLARNLSAPRRKL